MIKTLTLALVAVIASSAADAGELKSNNGKSFMLASASGSLYYTAEKDGLRVVATVMPSDGGTPIRMVATLADGQKMAISVPAAVDDAPVEMAIERTGDTITVSDAPAMLRTADLVEVDTVETGAIK